MLSKRRQGAEAQVLDAKHDYYRDHDLSLLSLFLLRTVPSPHHVPRYHAIS